MTNSQKRQDQAKVLRNFRKIHRATRALLFVFFFFISVTGLLLGWKKHSSGLILSKSYMGASSDLKKWLPLDSLHENACRILHDSISSDLSLELDRIDVRKDNGMVKFVFIDNFGVSNWTVSQENYCILKEEGQTTLKRYTMVLYLIIILGQQVAKLNWFLQVLWDWHS